MNTPYLNQKSCQSLNLLDPFSEKILLLEPQDLFEESKRLLNAVRKYEVDDGENLMDGRLAALYHLAWKKLNQKGQLDVKSYVGFLTILAYIRSSAKHFCISLNFQNSFYKNLHNKTQQAYALLQNSPQKGQASPALITLSTLLFVLCTFTHQNQNAANNLDLNKVFGRKLVNTIIRMKLPDNGRILRHYRTLLLHIYRSNPSLLKNSIALKSLTYQLLNSSSSPNTEVTLIYILSKINFKTHEENANTLGQILPKLKQLLICNQEHPSAKLVFFLIGKIIMQGSGQCRLFCVLDLIKFFQNQIGKVESLSELGPGTEMIIKSLTSTQIFQLYVTVQKKSKQSLALEIMHLLIKYMTPQLLLQVLEAGLWNQITNEIVSASLPRNSSRMYLLWSLTETILSKSFSEDIKTSLKRSLYPFTNGQFLSISNPYLH